MKINWYGPKIKKQIEDEMRNRIRASAIMVQGHAKELISVEGTGVWASKKAKRGSIGWRSGWVHIGQNATVGQIIMHRKTGALVHEKRTSKSQRLAYNAFPSKPGEPPRVQTGRLRGSVAWEMSSKFIARVGTNVKYGRWLESGTRKMRPRPWLRRALNEMVGEINRILGLPIKLH